MQLNLLIEKTRAFIDSFLFPAVIGLFALLTWVAPNNLAWLPAVCYSLIAFLPIACKDGRAYMPLMLFAIIVCSKSISFTSIPSYLYLLLTAILVSEIIFIIIRKPKFIKGDILVPFATLFVVFLISYFYNSIKNNSASSEGILYLLFLFLALLLYVVFSTVLGRGETINYFCKTYAFLAIFIGIEIFIYQTRNGFGFIGGDLNLGWSYNSKTASTLLCLSLPFFSLLLSKKQFLYIVGEIFTIYNIIILSTDSGLLCLILGLIPLILLTFKTYGKYYPYISLAAIVSIGVTFALLMAFNARFNSRVLTAIQSLNIFDSSIANRVELYDHSIQSFLDNPLIGTSISSLITNSGTVLFLSNTVLSTMVLGGSFGLIAYVLLEIKIYYCCFKKQTSDKYLFLLFLLLFELIGLVDNTLFNIVILLLFLTANSCYQMSNRPDDVLVHDEYFQTINNKNF